MYSSSECSKYLSMSHSFVKHMVRSKLPFSLIRSLIDCHFMSYGMLLMNTLLRLSVFFSPEPALFSFAYGWNLFLCPREGMAFGFETYFPFPEEVSSFPVSSFSLHLEKQEDRFCFEKHTCFEMHSSYTDM